MTDLFHPINIRFMDITSNTAYIIMIPITISTRFDAITVQIKKALSKPVILKIKNVKDH